MRPTYLFTMFLVLQGVALMFAAFFHKGANIAYEAGLTSILAAIPMFFAERHAASPFKD